MPSEKKKGVVDESGEGFQRHSSSKSLGSCSAEFVV